MSGFLNTRHGPIHWKDYGGSGPTMVMVHGLGGSIASWDIVAPRLATRYHVVAMDLPGFGLTPPWGDYTLETHVNAIHGFIQGLGGGPVVLVGNSLGALLCEMVASGRPDDVGGLILISPATPPRLPDPRVNWAMAARLALMSIPGVGIALSKYFVATRSSEELIRESLDRISHQTSRIPLDLIQSFVSLAEVRKKFPWATEAVPKTGRSIREYFMKPSRFVAMIREIKAPTLVVQGVADPIVSPNAVEWLCSLRSDWELVQLEDTGHTPQVDAPVRLLDTLEPWLERHNIHRLSA